MYKRLILGSKSPRRKEILAETGYTFDILSTDEEEIIDTNLPVEEVPLAIAVEKAKHIGHKYPEVISSNVLLTADTVVVLQGNIIGKPKSLEDAKSILHQLSGNKHKVISGVYIKTKEEVFTITDETSVAFKQLSRNEIDYYVNHYEVLDKAGAYAIQEWIGKIGINYIHGSYYNVMGLPIHKIYPILQKLNIKIHTHVK